VISFFHQLHLGISELKTARAECGITRGLEAIGKTRFGTFTRATQSVKHCTPAIKRVAVRKKVTFEFSDCFQPNNLKTDRPPHETLLFEIQRDEILVSTSPFAKAITCLEANDTNPADVFLFVHAAFNLAEEALEDEATADISTADKDKIYSIMTYRYNQVFSPNGNLYSPVYLIAAYLNPSKSACLYAHRYVTD
jgi:hypothetical protein